MEDKSDKDSTDGDIGNETGRKSNIFNRSKLIWGLGIAASLTLIFVLLYVLLLKPAELTGEQIYATYFKPFPYDDSRSDAHMQDGFALYTAGKYDESVHALTLLANDATNQLIEIYLGNALLMSGQTKAAIQRLESIDPDKEDQFLQQHKAWYLGLAYLKDDQLDMAVVQFQYLNDEVSIYKESARSVIAAIEQIRH